MNNFELIQYSSCPASCACLAYGVIASKGEKLSVGASSLFYAFPQTSVTKPNIDVIMILTNELDWIIIIKKNVQLFLYDTL